MQQRCFSRNGQNETIYNKLKDSYTRLIVKYDVRKITYLRKSEKRGASILNLVIILYRDLYICAGRFYF